MERRLKGLILRRYCLLIVSVPVLLCLVSTSIHEEQKVVEIKYPEAGKVYFFDTTGKPSILLSILGKSLVIDSCLKVGVETKGDVDKVSILVYSGNSLVDEKTFDGRGKFNCRFYLPSHGYRIVAIAYYNGKEISRETVDGIIFLRFGGCMKKKPVAVIEAPKVVWQGKEVHFDGSQSYDPDGGDIVSYHWEFGDGSSSDEISPIHAYSKPGKYTVTLEVTDDEGQKGTASKKITVVDYDLGVWIVTKYEGKENEVKLDIDVDDFINMLYHSPTHRIYKLTMQREDDVEVRLDFAKTKIRDIEAILTDFRVSIDESTDLTKDFEVSLEFRFPYSLLESEEAELSAEYFSARVTYRYDGGGEGPHNVGTWFYFGKESLRDPGILRMKIDPYLYGGNPVPLTYEASLLTVDSDGNEAFHRVITLKIDPAPEVTVTSVPREGKIEYYFEETPGLRTSVELSSKGTLFEDFVQSFILDPLPSYMRFDLTLLGERSFVYEADRPYDVTYLVNSTQNGNVIRLELKGIPERIEARWGLNASLIAGRALGFIDLKMSDNLDEASLHLKGSEKPFIRITNFPKNLYVAGFIDIPGARGYIELEKYSGSTTTITVPVNFKGWRLEGILRIKDGHAKAFYDLPAGDGYGEVGLDTEGKKMFGLSFLATKDDHVAVKIDVKDIATDDFALEWNRHAGIFKKLRFRGEVDALVDAFIMVDYEDISFNVTGTWELGEGGELLLQLNKDLNVTFIDMDSPDFKIYGYISLYGNRKLKLDWEFDETGHLTIYTFGKAVGREFNFTLQYDPDASYNYQYGCSLVGRNFINITRTIMWDTVNGRVPRIWILGDKPLPGDWDVKILWKGEWYPVPYP